VAAKYFYPAIWALPDYHSWPKWSANILPTTNKPGEKEKIYFIIFGW